MAIRTRSRANRTRASIRVSVVIIVEWMAIAHVGGPGADAGDPTR